jgi:ubiquitin-protein ligase
MHDSPRIRRLHNDLAALERLSAESSVLRFRGRGNPVQHYVVEFLGRSLARERGKVSVRERHEVEIKLGSSYPRTMPEIRWQTPIYHPNISEIGMVCLGGYGTHWVPSLNLDELCSMLWDMARYHNYDIRSPYNRDAALWVANQSTFRFPLDARPLRDLRAALGRVAIAPPALAASNTAAPAGGGNGQAAPANSGRYREFVRKFSDSLHSIEAATVRTRNGSANQGPSAPDDQIILDIEVDLRQVRSRPETNEGIVFIE